jgi:hypothetical protein
MLKICNQPCFGHWLYLMAGGYGNLKENKMLKALTATLLIFMLFVTPCVAADVQLAWDAVDPAPTGYRIYMAPAGQAYDYDNPIYEGNALSATVVIPNYNAEFKFVARAYLITPEGAEYESVDSNEVRHAIVMVVQNLRIE